MPFYSCCVVNLGNPRSQISFENFSKVILASRIAGFAEFLVEREARLRRDSRMTGEARRLFCRLVILANDHKQKTPTSSSNPPENTSLRLQGRTQLAVKC